MPGQNGAFPDEWANPHNPLLYCSAVQGAQGTGLQPAPQGFCHRPSAFGTHRLSPLFLLYFSAPSAQRNFILPGAELSASDDHSILPNLLFMPQPYALSPSGLRLLRLKSQALKHIKLSPLLKTLVSAVSKSLFCNTEAKADSFCCILQCHHFPNAGLVNVPVAACIRGQAKG